MVTGRRVPTAHAGVWQEEGRLRAGRRGAVAEVAGIGVMRQRARPPAVEHRHVRDAGPVDVGVELPGLVVYVDVA